MKAIVIENYGGIETLVEKSVADPKPSENEVLVRVKAAGINPIDWKLRKGQLKRVVPLRFPAILGCDLAGVVEETGSGVTYFREGDPVFGMTVPGCPGAYGELVRVPENQLARKPANVPFEMAAAVPLAGLTAYQALRDFGQLRGMMRVLIHGISGGVGLFALQIARIHGAKVTGVCSEKNADFVRSMQAHDVLDYRKEKVFSGTPQYDLILDAVGKTSPREVQSVLNPKGAYVSTLPTGSLLWRHFWANLWNQKSSYYASVRPNRGDLEDLARWLEAGKLHVELEARYPFSEVRSAHARSETGRVRGKLVLTH